MKRLLIFYDYFDPAYKAGGPIRSLVNLDKLLEEELDIYILTSNQDHDGSILDVVSDQWISYGERSKVQYLSNTNRGYKSIKNAIREAEPDVVYINGMYSIPFVVSPLRMFKGNKHIKKIIAPRGMLQKGALRIKPIKKHIYLKVLKLLFPVRHYYWHATDQQEKLDIQTIIGKCKINVVGNLPNFFQRVIQSKISNLNFVSISLIAKKKNHLAFLNSLKNIEYTGQITYHIFGPISDQSYLDELDNCIRDIPNSVNIEYKGELHPKDVSNTLGKYKFYVLTSFGENFGHSIFEALNQGIPVIISDQTPWKGLKEKQAGWDVDLNDPNALTSAIQEAISMDDQTYLQYCKGARQVAENYMQSHDFKKLYLELFS